MQHQKVAQVRVHPHVCGEYVLHHSPFDLLNRFTPTCVGNIIPKVQGEQICRVHPHVCGEYIKIKKECVHLEGSPPRVWGISYWGKCFNSNSRFTPTCVGNIFWINFLSNRYLGSPPRVWGILSTMLSVDIHHRFTPTCVGNILS